MLFGYEKLFLEEKKAILTAEEIFQQPELWKETLDIVKKDIVNLQQFLEKSDWRKAKIIFTGAGTSEFIGNTLAPFLRKKTGLDIESRATTDIVANPDSYIPRETKVILISFARSGNSPESVAAVELAEKFSKNISHIFVTCNPQGKLAKKKGDNIYTFLMPEKSNDAGFAMTGSFSCMLLAASLILRIDRIEELSKEVEELSKKIKLNMIRNLESIKLISKLELERVIFLGSGSLKGIAQELSLKLLELCAGKIPTMYDSPMGFRHGPKSIVNSKTLIFNLISPNFHAKKYDIDLVKELVNDGVAKKIITLNWSENNIAGTIGIDVSYSQDEILQGLSYLVIGQIFAFIKSLELGITPDNPCPTGEVNRVVQGVIIHGYTEGEKNEKK